MMLRDDGVGGVFMMRPSSSSFGVNLRVGKMHVLNMSMALSRCRGHLLGKVSQSIFSYLSSLRPGAQSCFRMCSSILFVPPTSPFIHGE